MTNNKNCDHNCGGCSADCESREAVPESFLEKPHEKSAIKKTVGIMSGKGGVGKSFVTAMLAVLLQRSGDKAAILDADITGPSIPKMFGITEKATAEGDAVIPVKTKNGIEIISINLLLEHDTEPVVWRGPIIANVVKQFWTDVIWNEVDVMLVDMPPGTGDVPLTVFQSLPLDGVIVVATPQDLVSMIVEKAVNMAKMMDVPVLGLVENMSYFECPDCKKRIPIFGESKARETAEKFGIPLLAQVPVDPAIAKAGDEGKIEDVKGEWLEHAAEIIAK